MTTNLTPVIGNIECVHPKPGETVVVRLAAGLGVSASAVRKVTFPNNRVVVLPEGVELTIKAGESEAPEPC